MKISRLIPLIILLALTSDLYAGNNSPLAKKGIIDLRELKNPDKFIVTLNGEWEFYWKQLLRPNDFKNKIIKPDYFGKVPSYWSDYPQESVKTEKLGYATYRLSVLLPSGYN